MRISISSFNHSLEPFYTQQPGERNFRWAVRRCLRRAAHFAAAKLLCISILRRVNAPPVHCGEGAYDAVPASFEVHRSRAYVERHVDVLRQRVVELLLVRDQDVLVIFGLLVGEYLPAALFF